MNRRALLLTPLALACGRAAAAESTFRLGPISITHPWVPPSVAEAAALFLHIVNDGPTRERLIAASTPIAGTMIFRAHDGTPLEYFDLWPKRPLELGPGRRYIALRDLKGPLALDDRLPVTLRFASAGAITVTAVVEAGAEDDIAG
ncbi:MAG TPA: copper chaperone PCu(A)C [Stellaceae bacterium]|jgi:copper(I)-binding protein|nr:copper chaperone PCu(A)C [Stellaceae bacterium]